MAELRHQRHTKEYDSYIRSEAWKAKEQERKQLDDYKCVMCGRPEHRTKHGLIVHHIHYGNLGHEPLEDLVTLCNACHKKIHLYYKRWRTWEQRQQWEKAD